MADAAFVEIDLEGRSRNMLGRRQLDLLDRLVMDDKRGSDLCPVRRKCPCSPMRRA
jgi:hypothetical protein